MNDNLKAHIEAGCEKYECSANEKERIISWCESTTDPLALLILEQVAVGMMEIVGWNGDEPTFRLAAAGMAHVRGLLKKHGASSPAGLLGLPDPEKGEAS